MHLQRSLPEPAATLNTNNCTTDYIDSEDSNTMAPSGRKLYYWPSWF